MYTSKDGKNFGNHEMGKHYDATRPEPKEEEADKGEHEEGEQDIQDVVSEHGPAEHVEISSHHKDGHVHKSKHHDGHSARSHVSQAFGEEPEHEAEAPMEHESPGAIPTMA